MKFNSSSAAATCFLAIIVNGWSDWTNKEGNTLEELKS